MIDKDAVFAGCWCRFHLTAFAWDHPVGGKGVSFSLNAVQLVRQDERLDGRVTNVADIFDPIEIEAVEEDQTSDTEDMADLFG